MTSRTLPRWTGVAEVIASVHGRVAAVAPDGAVVEVGGIGLAVHCTPGTLARLRVGEQARLATSLIVREDSLTLYGFADDDERQLFELLQTASGVGPRLAQAVLAVHPPREVRRAVATGDLKALTRVPGIGKKGAERLVLELRDRLGSTTTDTSSTAARCRPGRADHPGRAVAGPVVGRAGRARLERPRGRPGGLRRWRRSPPSSSPRPAGSTSRRCSGRRCRCWAGHDTVVVSAAGGEHAVRPRAHRRGRRRARARPRGQPAGGRRGAGGRGGAAAAAAGGLRRPAQGGAPARPGARGRHAPRPAAGPRAALRRARAGQDQPGPDRRRRARRGDAGHQRAGHRAVRRPGRDPHRAQDGDVLFVDEIHRIARPAEELLYIAMEDFRVDVVVGKGPGATAIPLEVAPFTLVGATTRAGLLTGPLRDRFGFVGHMDFYEPAELEQVLARSAGLLGVG